MAKSNGDTIKLPRDSKTGRFTTKEDAKRRPGGTEVETRKRRSRKKTK